MLSEKVIFKKSTERKPFSFSSLASVFQVQRWEMDGSVSLSTEGFLSSECWKGVYEMQNTETLGHQYWTKLSGHWVPLLFHGE